MNTAIAKVDVDFSKAGQLGNDFLKELDKVREADAIHWSDLSQCWVITRHQDIIDAMADTFPLSLDRLPQIAFQNIPDADRERSYPNLNHYLKNWIINLDPPAHTRLRKLLMKAFSKKIVDGMKPFVEARVAELLTLMSSENKLEFNEQVARQLPGSVILDMIGLSQDNRSKLKGWADAFVQGIGVPFVTPELLLDVENAMVDMNDILLPELEARKSAPQNDLLTALVQARDEGDKLSTEEMLGALHVLIVAGHDSTANTMTLALAALADHPDVWDYMYQQPEQTPNVILELMRYIAMSASQPRIVAEDFQWHGKALKKGQVLFLMMAAGNRDPRKFENPTALDVNRVNDASLVFGPGVHHCIGHMLAKLQLNTFFSAVVDQFSGVEILDDKLKFMHQLAFRGLSEFNVRMIKR